MGPNEIAILGTLVLFFFMAAGMPVGFALAGAGVLGLLLLRGLDITLHILTTHPLSTVTVYALIAIPLFVLMGLLAAGARAVDDAYEASNKLLGRLPGGLAISTVVACGMFAAVSGSSVATAATIGRAAIPEMLRFKYSPVLATATVAAGGTLGVLIPPSVILIVYGLITEQSITKLLLAGVLPGLLSIAIYVLVILCLVWRNPALAPTGPVFTMRERVLAMPKLSKVVLLSVIVIGGIYSGIFTATEAAGVGAMAALLLLLLFARKTWATVWRSLLETAETTGMVFAIVIGAALFGLFLTMTGVPMRLAEWVTQLPMAPIVILLMILLLYIPLGMVLDGLAMMVLTLPIVFPVVVTLGFDPIWFAILMVKFMEIGLITPPVGLNVYVILGIAPGVRSETVFRGVIPFLAADAVTIAILMVFPQITLVLTG